MSKCHVNTECLAAQDGTKVLSGCFSVLEFVRDNYPKLRVSAIQSLRYRAEALDSSSRSEPLDIDRKL